MKHLIFLVFFVKHCSCYGSNLDIKRYWPGFDYGDVTAQDHVLHHHREYDDKHEHHEDNIERPCPKYDEHCIRQVLEVNFGCLPVYGYVSEPYRVKRVPLYVPSSNASVVLYDVQLKGFNSGKVIEFYINKKTDTLVLEVEFDTLVIYSPKSVVTFYRKGKEPVQSTDFSSAECKHLSFTLTVQHIHDVSLYESYVFASFTSLQLTAGPELEKGEGFISIRKGDITVTGQEALVSQAPLYMAAFLRSKICDFSHYI